MDTYQTAPIGGVLSVSTLFVNKATLTFQQTSKADDFNVIGVLRVNIWCDTFY